MSSYTENGEMGPAESLSATCFMWCWQREGGVTQSSISANRENYLF